jgi:hypothetical protein
MNRYHCTTCNMYFLSSSELQRHLNGVRHAEPVVKATKVQALILKCQDCGKDFADLNSLRLHKTATNHGGLSVVSPERKATTKTVVKQTRCEECDIDCRTSHNLELHLGGRSHRRRLESRKAFCELCKVQCESLISFQQHLQGARHTRALHGSASASASAPVSPALRPKPMSSDDNADDGEYFCRACGLDLKNPHNYKLHMEGSRHAKRAIPPCLICDVTFTTWEDRDKHMRNDHTQGKAAKAKAVTESLSSLEKMNEWLKALGKEPQASKNKARAELRTVNINLFDLENGNFDKVFDSVSALRKYTRKHRLFFPKQAAKASEAKAFLRKMF